MTRRTLAELLGMTPQDLASLLDLPLERAEQLAAEPVYQDDLKPPAPGDEMAAAFEWGRFAGLMEERYGLIQARRLVARLQERLGWALV